MPNTFKTPLATAQENRGLTREAHPSARDIQQPLKFAKFEYTQGSVAAADDDMFLLGSLQVEGAVIIPELSRVWNVGGGDADLDVKLRTGTTDLTSLASIDNNSVAFTRPTGLTVPALGAADFIHAFVDNYEALAAGEVLHFEIAYRSAKTSN